MSTSTKAQRKMNLSALADADQYEPVVAGCLSDKQAKLLPARHLANGLALMAELILTHYDGIAEAFDTNNGVEISLKLQLGGQKDELKISYKPASEVKDAASAAVPDPNQEEMDFVKPKPKPKPATASGPSVVDVEALPAPALGLPAPERTKTEQDAWDRGQASAIKGEAFSANPYLFRSPEWHAWADGWRSEANEGEPEAGDGDLDIQPREEGGPMDLDENLSDHADSEEE
jgi:hypothetical protein